MQDATPTNRLHPLIATAAIAVTAVSVLGAVVLVTNRVSAQHADAPAAAVTAAVPSPTATDAAALAAPPMPVTALRATDLPRSTTRATNHASTRASTTPVQEPAPQVAQAPAAALYPPPPAVIEQPVQAVAQNRICVDCGSVTSVREIKTPGEGSGIGVIAGGVLGGVLGNQFGHGNGKDATRILGAIGGAVAGHQIEKQARATTRYEVTVRMDDGALKTLTRTSDPGVKAGDRVRVDGDQLRAADGAVIAPRPAPRSPSAQGDA
jgi:outer membrane lipoprotein SlyB